MKIVTKIVITIPGATLTRQNYFTFFLAVLNVDLHEQNLGSGRSPCLTRMGCWLSDRVVPWLKQNETLVANAIPIVSRTSLGNRVIQNFTEVGTWGYPGTSTTFGSLIPGHDIRQKERWPRVNPHVAYSDIATRGELKP